MLLIILQGCCSLTGNERNEEVENALYLMGMDTWTSEDALQLDVYWEAPGESENEVITAMYVVKGVVEGLGIEKDVVLHIMKDEEEYGKIELKNLED